MIPFMATLRSRNPAAARLMLLFLLGGALPLAEVPVAAGSPGREPEIAGQPVATGATTPRGESQIVALITEIRGSWSLEVEGEPLRPLAHGEGIPSGGRISPKSRAPNDKITVVYLYEREPGVCSCEDVEACGQPTSCRCKGQDPCLWPLEVNGPPASSLGGRLWHAATRFFSRPHGTYTTVLSRGGGDLHDAVVPWDGAKLDLREVLQDLEDGRYVLLLESPARPKPDSKASTLAPTTFNWESGRTSHVAVASLTPGLYRIRLEDADSTEQYAIVGEAWVLVADAANYGRLVASYRQALDLTIEWDDAVKGSTTQGFLRAYMEMLAEEDLQSP